KGGGGRAYAVYNPDVPAEFAPNDRLLQSGRIHGYGPADYTAKSSTAQWLRMHLHQICDRIVADREAAVASKATKPPRHLNATPAELAAAEASRSPKQSSFLDES
ncbi:MAG TPA: haloacid dehalogenase-like hydrolase, partial [Opitutus sp.]|nr:haloacid dehalogenase-like hydrolase [Opitutus sp.]